jgi:hypothetical protein
MPEPPRKVQQALEAAQAELSTLLPKLSPDDFRKIADAIATAIERDDVPREKQKDILRRLGCREDLQNFDEFWRQLWAAARSVGIQEEEFWFMTPRDLHAVLEYKAKPTDVMQDLLLSSRQRAGELLAGTPAALADPEPAPATTSRLAAVKDRRRGREPGVLANGEKIRQLRPEGHKQFSFAADCSLSVAAYRKAETGKRVDKETLRKIAEHATTTLGKPTTVDELTVT